MTEHRRRGPARRARLIALACLAVAGAAALPESASAYVYYTTYSRADNGHYTVGRANLDGSGINNTFITGVDSDPNGLIASSLGSLAVDSGHVYWVGDNLLTGPRIGRANLDGTGVAATWLPVKALQLAADGQHFYWLDGDYSGSITRAQLDGSGVEPGWIAARSTGGLALDAGHIYWLSTRGVDRANIDGSGVQVGFIAVPAFNAVAVDAGHVYWSSGTSIGRANLDGSGVEPSIITGLTHVWSIAVDAGHIYWVDGLGSPDGSYSGGNTIGRANLDGSGVETAFITTGLDTGTFSVAVDSLSDTTPPQTTITGPLRARLHIGNRRRVMFKFTSSEPRSTFQCKLGAQAAFKPCVSPVSRLFTAPRTFAFLVRAVDLNGNVDPTPAKKVLKLVR